MIKQMLVGIDGSEYGEAAIQYGIQLAKRFTATLHGLHVVDIVQAESPVLYDLAGAIGAAPLLNLTSQMRANLEQRGRQLLENFQELCQREHVPCKTHLETGVVPIELLRVADEMDLIILGRGGLHTRLSKALLGSAVENVVRQSHVPTLVTTRYHYHVTNPLLATDGSPSAMAALHVAACFVQTLGLPLHVVHCTPDAASGQPYLDEARAQLASYPIASETHLYVGNAYEDLVQYMLDHGHDMLFMGAFGRRRLAEWVLGSTTQYILRTCPGPLLLCRAPLKTTT